MKTRGGVYHDLKETEYVVSIGKLTFYFSSAYNMNRFLYDYRENRKYYEESLKKRFKFHVELNELFDIMLYNKIEKRGTRIEKGGCEICLNNIKFVGQMLTSEN